MSFEALGFSGEIKKANIGPGDFLVIRLDEQPSDETIERIQVYFETALRGVAERKVPIVVLGPGADLQIMHDSFDAPLTEG